MRAFSEEIIVHFDAELLDIQMRKIPATDSLQSGFSSVGLVAGARSDRVQRNLVALSAPLRGRELVVPRAA